ncbi:UNVERIFIED_CONTAM: hypothetical protein HDU68_010397 [Siphonaria sp. JEL0065]|nr:hypothetical protein HDU68_010397 [Siphonaria sp. JEL0065]
MKDIGSLNRAGGLRATAQEYMPTGSSSNGIIGSAPSNHRTPSLSVVSSVHSPIVSTPDRQFSSPVPSPLTPNLISASNSSKPATPVIQQTPQKSQAFMFENGNSSAESCAGGSNGNLAADTKPEDVERMIISRGLNPNPALFDLKPSNARFFVIKSFREDHIFKSIKHSVWSSTEIGNKRLHQAYNASNPPKPVATASSNNINDSSRPPRHRQTSAPASLSSSTALTQKQGGPIILFFSVNGSGHFCGAAQMTSPVDWTKKSSVFTKDGKWDGIFTVRWVFVKDVPNSLLRHLKVFANENKPVTNSRDTQELPADVGYEMLKIFGEFERRTCLLDDWNWYERREEAERQ